jgi:lysophospholipase L1-like esterase
MSTGLLTKTGARGLPLAVAGMLLGSCGGGSSSPTTPPPSPTPEPTAPPGNHSLTATVYYDFLSNDILDPSETVRFGGVSLDIGGGSGTSESGTGEALVQGISAGTHSVEIELSTLPPFFVPGASVTVEVPADKEVLVPVALPIRQNQAFRYLCSGDSITKGDGSADEMGYRSILQPALAGYYGVAIDMKYRGRGGGTSAEGLARTERDLELVKPAYTLIGWGTNDYNNCGSPPTCPTVANLRSMVQMVKAASSMPCVATLVPANPDLAENVGRNEWIEEMNQLIEAMAREEGALLVDLHAAFVAAGNPSGFFVDHVHPSPAGYDVIARTWFDALTLPRARTPGAAHAGVEGP